LSCLHLPRNLQVNLFPRHKSVLVSNPSKFEQASELVRKVFTSSRCYLHWCLLKVESTLTAWFWRAFILLFVPWRSSTWVFGLQVTTIGWSSKVRLGFDTYMPHVSWLVRRLARVGVCQESTINVSETVDLRFGRPRLVKSLSSEVFCSPGGPVFCFPDVVERSWWSLKHVAKIVVSDLREVLREEL
jgi:hypothetical protein